MSAADQHTTSAVDHQPAHAGPRWPAIARAALVYFAIAFAAGFALGIIRQLILLPRVGVLAAVTIELPVILTIAWYAARAVIGRFRISPRTSDRLAVGVLAFACLQAAEYALFVAISGSTASAYLAELTTTHGLLGLAAQIAFAWLPMLVNPEPHR